MEVDRTSDRLRAIIRTQTEIAASSLEPEAIMDLIADRARELTGAEAAMVELAIGAEMVAAATSGAAADIEAPRGVDTSSLLCAPLVHDEVTVGMLTVYSARTDAFDPCDVETLELLAGLIAAHLAHANLHLSESEAARRDELTALPNRLAFEERLPIELARASRSEEPLALCLLDLDGFRRVNDRLGHPAGDAVLREVARILDDGRTSDDCFRLGGDEFALLMPRTDREDAAFAAERVAERVRRSGLGEGTVGIFFGVAATTDLDQDALFAEADRALLEAKDQHYGR